MGKAKNLNAKGPSSAQPLPEGFTLSMALVDCLPVLFFCLASGILAYRFDSILFRIGILLVILAGAMKAGWKFVIALLHRDLRFLNRQMRYLMPIGFLLMLLALFVDRSRWSIKAVLSHITHFPSLFFFLLGFLGILFLIWLAGHQNNREAKANWKEQIVNSFAQACFLLGIWL
ncbi:MAG: hypothetical protein PUG16_04700 [Lachnospiraceae bacterium]|nr:hypothetical protein [Lachnospiraceae bacterium]